MRLATTIIISLLFQITLWAQSPSWRTVNIEPNIDIKNIVSDSLGFLWLHDDHSLYRFDGVEAASKLELKDEKISALDYSSSDHIVIGTNNGRVILFNPYSNQQVVLYENSTQEPVSASYVKDKSNYIVLHYGSGIELIVNDSIKNYSITNGLLSNEVYDIEWYDEKYYIATDQGIQIIDPIEEQLLSNTLSIENGLSDVIITHLNVYNGVLWYTDYNRHLGSISKQGKILNYELPINSKINNIESHESGIYIGTDDGLFKFNNGEIQKKILPDDNEKIDITQIDEEGNLWIFKSNGNFYKGNIYFQKTILDLDPIRAVEKYNNQTIIGNKTGLYRLSNGKPIKIATENVTHLRTINEYLLVGTFSQGIKVYDMQFNIVHTSDSWANIENESILFIYYFNQEVYISSLSGVMKFDFTNGILRPISSLNDIIGQGYIYTMLIAGEKMYFGTDRNGIYVWNRSSNSLEKFIYFHSGEKIGSVYSMTMDTHGKIWFTSTEQGLGYLDAGKPTLLANIINSTDEYTSIATTDNGNLLTVRGNSIDILDPVSQHIMYFDRELGLDSDITYLNNIVLDNDETYFAHDHSLFTYMPSDAVKIHPEVIIDQKRVNLSPVEQKNVFSENENNIEFDFRGSWLTDPSKLMYQYKLEGFDKEWRTTKDNSISFPKLRPGKYKFRLRASENGMFHDEPETEYSFKIKKHFYNLWWVQLILFGIISSILILLFRQREVRKKEKLALEKLNIENQFNNLKNQLNPHFLFNAFNTLIGLIEEDNDRSIDFVEKMADFYRNILEYGKSNMILLSEEREIMYQYIDILKARFNGQLNIESKFEDDLESYEIPPMTLQLLIENAVKHNVVSTKDPLHITITQNGDTLLVKNIKSALINPSQGTKTGLTNIKRRFELINLATPIIRETDEEFEILLKMKHI